MSSARKTVKLSSSVEVHKKSYSEIVLREPNAADFLELGPLTASYRSGEVESSHDLPKTASEYLKRCVTNVPEPFVTMDAILIQIPLKDGIRLRRALNEFFMDAVDVVFAEEKAVEEKAAADPALAALARMAERSVA